MKALGTLLILALLTYSAYLVLRETDTPLPESTREAPGARMLLSMQGFRFVQSGDGKVSWRVQSERADLFESKQVRMQGIELAFTSPDNREAVLRGEHGDMDLATGSGSVRRGERDVRVVTSDGYLLTTSALMWRARDRVVKSIDPFKLLGKEIYVEGRQFAANADMRKIVVTGDVKAILQE